jgi:hypothetical protein
MRDWAVRPNDWNANLMVLGDFNLDRIGDPLYEAFVAPISRWPSRGRYRPVASDRAERRPEDDLR